MPNVGDHEELHAHFYDTDKKEMTPDSVDWSVTKGNVTLKGSPSTPEKKAEAEMTTDAIFNAIGPFTIEAIGHFGLGTFAVATSGMIDPPKPVPQPVAGEITVGKPPPAAKPAADQPASSDESPPEGRHARHRG